MLDLLLRLAQLLHETLPAQVWDVHCTAIPFGGDGQENSPLPSPPQPKLKGVTRGPQDAFPSKGWGSPRSRGGKGRCWVFHPQRARELLTEVDVSEQALRSGFDGASSTEYIAASEHPHGAVHRAKLAGRLANVESRGQAGSIQVPTSNSLPSKTQWSASSAGKPAPSLFLQPFFCPSTPHVTERSKFPILYRQRLGFLRGSQQRCCSRSVSDNFRSLLQCTQSTQARKLSVAGKKKKYQPLLNSVFTSCWGSLGNKQLPRKIPPLKKAGGFQPGWIPRAGKRLFVEREMWQGLAEPPPVAGPAEFSDGCFPTAGNMQFSPFGPCCCG
ncbi:uncharacterized protein ACIBXB_000551 [Morphnus guianensis]